MTKIHFTIITLICSLCLCVILLITLQIYVRQDTVPRGTTIAGLQVGGLKKNEALQILERKFAAMKQEPIVFEVEDIQMNLTWRDSGVAFDATNFRLALTQLSDGKLWNRVLARKNFPKTWEFHTTFDSKVLKKIFSPAWEKSQFGEPVNAVRSIASDDSIRYIPGRQAQRINWEAFENNILSSLPSVIPNEENGVKKHIFIVVPLHLIQPSVTIETLQQEGIRRKIAQFSTGLQNSSTGRIYNVDAVARTIDGMTLSPDDIFDYATIIESTEETYGFREAPVIFGGKLVPGVGGGICQVSSTLYNVSIRAGLTIIERRNHSLPVSYVPKGQDATFAKGYINFRFKNTSGHHLLIRAQVENRVLTIKLFGDLPQNVSYEIQSRTSEILPTRNKYVINKTLPVGSREVIVQGKTGFIVETYRIKKIDGKIIETRKLSKDTYPSQPTVIATNEDMLDKKNDPSETNPKHIVEDGVEGPTFR